MFSTLLLTGPLEDVLCLLWRGPGASHKVTVLPSRQFFPSVGWPCHEGWEKGGGREAKISCLGGGGFVCSLCDMLGSAEQGFVLVGNGRPSCPASPPYPSSWWGLSTMSLNLWNCLGLQWQCDRCCKATDENPSSNRAVLLQTPSTLLLRRSRLSQERLRAARGNGPATAATRPAFPLIQGTTANHVPLGNVPVDAHIPQPEAGPQESAALPLCR